MKKDSKDVKRPVLKSMVGTLDLRTRYLVGGETFPEVYYFCLKTKDFYPLVCFIGVFAKLTMEPIAGTSKTFQLRQLQNDALK